MQFLLRESTPRLRPNPVRTENVPPSDPAVPLRRQGPALPFLGRLDYILCSCTCGRLTLILCPHPVRWLDWAWVCPFFSVHELLAEVACGLHFFFLPFLVFVLLFRPVADKRRNRAGIDTGAFSEQLDELFCAAGSLEAK